MKTLFTSSGKLKFLFCFLVVLCLGGFACKKDKPQSNMSYHLSCVMDGQLVKFNVNDVGHIDYGDGDEAFQIDGFINGSDTSAAIGFVIVNHPSGDTVIAGTYTDRSTKFEVLAAFQPKLSEPNHTYDAGTTFYHEAGPDVTITNHFKATITSLTSEAARGTFSGDYYENGDPSGKIITITDGEFYVKMQ